MKLDDLPPKEEVLRKLCQQPIGKYSGMIVRHKESGNVYLLGPVDRSGKITLYSEKRGWGSCGPSEIYTDEFVEKNIENGAWEFV